MSAIDDSKCSLFSLPPELRLKVYRFLMINHEDYLERGIIEILQNANATFTMAHPLSFQLLGVCSVVRDEAMPVLYGENTFAAGNLGGLRVALSRLCATTRNHIRSIGIKPLFWLSPYDHQLPRLPTLPPLPALKTVRLTFTGVHQGSAADEVTKGERFITKLVTTRPGDDNWLTTFMNAINNTNQAQWMIEIKTKAEKSRPATEDELGRHSQLPLPTWLPRLETLVPIESIYISVKATIIEIEEENGETRKKWHFINTRGNTTIGVAENQIAVMRKDLTVAKPKLELLRTIEF